MPAPTLKTGISVKMVCDSIEKKVGTVESRENTKSTVENKKKLLRPFSRKFKAGEIPIVSNDTPTIKKFKTESETAVSDEYVVPDEHAERIRFASKLPKEAGFEIFNDSHREAATHMIDVFYQVDLNDIEKMLKYVQSRVNISLIQYAYSVALLHRNDLGVNVAIPSHASIHPNMYFDMNLITDCLRNGKFLRFSSGKKDTILVLINENFTATNRDPEHKCAYFREDIGVNLHHRHWHEVYPSDGPKEIVRKDRRGELFVYMHQQIISRYNFERLSNHMPRVEPFEDLNEPIKEAYFPKLDSFSKSSDFGSRPADTRLKNLNRGIYNVKLAQMELWRNRIFDAIDKGYAYVSTVDEKTNQESLVLKKIDEITGIDELGNTVEAAEALSWNYRYYGNLHNRGHVIIGYSHDPDNRFKENSGVMSYAETAARDPIFYRWHVHTDDIFQYYKRTLPAYTAQQKEFENINILDVKILRQSVRENSKICSPHSVHTNNILTTFFEKDFMDITQGVHPKPKEPVQVGVVFTHLQHEPFSYEIKVGNNRLNEVIGTVRIFMAPHLDEAGMPMPFNVQRQFFMEMDKFTIKLSPQKITTINRKSTESSVTIPFEKTFMSYKDAKIIVKDSKSNQQSNKPNDSLCSCGWPQHLLVGKGTPGEGLLCDLFVMITDYEQDNVAESPLAQSCCEKASFSYCGVRNNKYPDRKPMGFPFDRNVTNVSATIDDFMTEPQNNGKNEFIKFSNMHLVPVLVRHQEGKPRRGQSLKELGCTEEEFQQKILKF